MRVLALLLTASAQRTRLFWTGGGPRAALSTRTRIPEALQDVAVRRSSAVKQSGTHDRGGRGGGYVSNTKPQQTLNGSLSAVSKSTFAEQ